MIGEARAQAAVTTGWPTEICILCSESRERLIGRVESLARHLKAQPDLALADVAHAVNALYDDLPVRLAIVSDSTSDLAEKLGYAAKRLADNDCLEIRDPRGVYFAGEPLTAADGLLAFLFPGEGSQYVNMMRDLHAELSSVQHVFEIAGALDSLDAVFPADDSEALERAKEELGTRIRTAIHALITADSAMLTLFETLEVQPGAVVGHSTGDYVACVAAGILPLEEVMSHPASGLWDVYDAAPPELAESGLLAVGSDAASAMERLGDLASEVAVAMDNCPHQAVLAGPIDAVRRARERLIAAGTFCELLPINHSYHTESFGAVSEPLGEIIAQASIRRPFLPIYSCTTADLYPENTEEIRALGFEHWRSTVRFRETVEKMYADGVRIFLECGPRGTLTAFVDDILQDRPHLALAADRPKLNGLTQLNHVIAQLLVHGVWVSLTAYYDQRSSRPGSIDLPELDDRVEAGADPPSAASTSDAEDSAPASRDAGPEMPPIDSPVRAETVRSGSLAMPVLSEGHVPVADGDMEAAVSAYMQTMDRFLSVQRSVMEAYLAGSSPSPDSDNAVAQGQPIAPTVGQTRSFPLLGSVTISVDGMHLESERSFAVDHDHFLRDHAFGVPAASDPTLRPLSVIPMMVSIEMMAEAACALVPGYVPIRARDVYCLKWLPIYESTDVVRLSATLHAEAGEYPEVDVSIQRVERATGDAAETEAPASGGRIVLAPSYPPAPVAGSAVPENARRAEVTVEELYDHLFHGPQYRTVKAVELIGPYGASGVMEAPRRDRFLADGRGDSMLVDCVSMDAATHVVVAWAYEQVSKTDIFLPLGVEEVEFFEPPPPAGARLGCSITARVNRPNVRADMVITDAQGNVLTRLHNWRAFLIGVDEDRWSARKDPLNRIDAEVQDWLVAGLSNPNEYAAVKMPVPASSGELSVTEMMYFGYLSRSERERYRGLSGSMQRRAQWLHGRLAAKDAVRLYLQRVHGLRVLPGDIEISQDERGALLLDGPWREQIAATPAVSIAHSGDRALAICGPGKLGIDVERITERPGGFEAVTFSSQERTLLDEVSRGQSRDEWITRFWCGKEAIAKALGSGLEIGPGSVAIDGVDVSSGDLQASLHKELAEAFPELLEEQLMVHTAAEEGYAFAVSVIGV